MRGSHWCRRPAIFSEGIIPAHAGLTLVSHDDDDEFRDHPRACGAHFMLPVDMWIKRGSSPRMRGSRRKPFHHAQARGIIPAHAGLTLLCHQHELSGWDHPRACGAHRIMRRETLRKIGSSPRMRGSLHQLRYFSQFAGIIPAHAGLTKVKSAIMVGCRDHPRACGAHIKQTYNKSLAMGSSPRMRGSPIFFKSSPLVTGIIPAHAGLTIHIKNIFNSNRDHPRACGAHKKKRRRKTAKKGSSPRMRGSLLSSILSVQRIGIIPAHAGLTRCAAAPATTRRDHPRACGAHGSLLKIGSVNTGSSPRMRGSLCRRIDRKREQGIIPAHAGLTPLIDGVPFSDGDHPRACGAH